MKGVFEVISELSAYTRHAAASGRAAPSLRPRHRHMEHGGRRSRRPGSGRPCPASAGRARGPSLGKRTPYWPDELEVPAGHTIEIRTGPVRASRKATTSLSSQLAIPGL